MKILETNVINGPNYWSINHKKLIAATLDIEEYEELPSNKIPGFYDRMINMLPSLYSHYCSEGKQGGFLERVKDGTWMGHIVEHIALELQNLAGMECGFGRTRQMGTEGIYQLVFSYVEKNAGIYALKAAVRIAEAIAKNLSCDLENDLLTLKKIFYKDQLGPSTSTIVKAALAQNIPYIRLDNESLVQLGYGANQCRIDATITEKTSCIGVDLASNKEKTKELLRKANIPVPDGLLISEENELFNAVAELGYPLVIKPFDGNHGKGVTINVNNDEEALVAYFRAKSNSKNVVIERFINGNDYRILVINYKFSAAALRTPAMVTGDGLHTVFELIKIANEDPNRGEGHEKILTRIFFDETTNEILKMQGHTLSTVPIKGENVFLKQTANLSTGGTSIDVTESVHPDIIRLAERAAKIIGLDICGIDIISEDISKPLKHTKSMIVEVNAAPGFRMHTHPFKGKGRDVGKDVIEMLFPEKNNGRIPIIAITGTNGKTTTTRLLSYIAKNDGFTVGYTTTEGIYIDGELIEEGDCTGPQSAQVVLKDKNVNFAVLECARGGMLREGLAFDQCKVGIVTNVAEDHIGLKGIDSLEKMAKVKSIVPESVAHDGYAILNADNEYTYQMKSNVSSKVALFSLHHDNQRVLGHISEGGLAAVFDMGAILIIDGKERLFVESVENIPMTFGGKALFMVENILAAVLGAYINKIPMKTIISSLQTFVLTSENNPGRLNLFNFKDFRLFVDYAHNFHGLTALGAFIKQEKATQKIGIIAAAGDRRNVDIVNVGKASADIFDKIIIRVDEDTCGRKDYEIIDLIKEGIFISDKNKEVEVIPDELDALRYVLQNAVSGALIVHLSENVKKCIAFLKEFQQREQNYFNYFKIKEKEPIYVQDLKMHFLAKGFKYDLDKKIFL